MTMQNRYQNLYKNMLRHLLYLRWKLPLWSSWNILECSFRGEKKRI